jgi:ATP-binding protein involved in chromosome partitioning
MINEDEVMKTLSEIQDPELHRPLADLGMIKSVEIDDGTVRVEVLLTIPGCPLKKRIAEDISQALEPLEGVESVDVKLGVMTEEQRQNLAARIYGKDYKKTAVTEDSEVTAAGDFARRVIAVASGKGGVGKSTVTSYLALALDHLGYTVGVLDADVYGFSIPRILGVNGQPTGIDQHIVPLRKGNIQVMSIGFFVDENTPVIWRGPLLHKTVNQFITDVLWDQLDFLLIDLPPGTGDVTISIAQALPKAEMVVVTTPQPVASNTAGRVARMTEHTNLSVLGIIENMSYFEINGRREYIFGEGGGKELAGTLKVPFLGEIPIKTEIREAADSGKTAELLKKNDIYNYYARIATAISTAKR